VGKPGQRQGQGARQCRRVLRHARGGRCRYRGEPHEHTHAEFFYVLDGAVRNQDEVITAGDGYAAAAGSRHTDFVVESSATYLIIFRL
jgi:ChrR Cupin-like domain